MSDKYYIPELEEFHVGFRYQESFEAILIDNGNGNKWSNTVELSDVDLGTFFPDPHTNYRVKYLDQSDIEELGWEYLGFHHFYNHDESFKLSGGEGITSIYLHLFKDGSLAILEGSENGYGLEGASYLFSGRVKNYNELKRLMRQLGISIRID